MSLIDLPDAKEMLRIPDASDASDSLLSDYVEAANIVIGYLTGVIDAASTTVTLDGGRDCVILPFGTTEVTGVTVDGVASTDWTFNSSAGILYAGTSRSATRFLPGRQNIVVTYSAGFDDPPANLKQAARELVRFWWVNGQQPNRPGAQSLAQQMEMVAGYWVPPFVTQACQPHAHPPGV